MATMDSGEQRPFPAIAVATLYTESPESSGS